MYSEGLLISSIFYESAKREALARLNLACERTTARIEAFIDQYDKKHYMAAPCLNNIMCERTGKRHKDGCPGRTEPFSVYAEGLRSIN